MHGVNVIKRIANEKGLFRERDLGTAAAPGCLHFARYTRIAKPHGHGVWSHYAYDPTRYELIQIRLKSAVFWGPSALWLLGLTKQEPEAMWIAVSNNSRRPQNLPLGTVVIRTRQLEQDAFILRQPGTLLDLRVYSRERAEADIARSDLPALLDLNFRPRFVVPRWAEMLSSNVGGRIDWRPPQLPPPPYDKEVDPEVWAVAHSLPPPQ